MTDVGINEADEQLYDAPRQFFGKYRGSVLDNEDPLMMGRLMVKVAAVPGSVLNWALPSVPYAGPGVGFFFMPPLDANVWVEFEGGDPNWPIWSGCFWNEYEVPSLPADPLVKVIKTDGITLTLSDMPEAGGVFLTVNEPSVAMPRSMTFTSEGITLTCEDAIINMTPEEISVSTAEVVVSVSPEEISALIEPSTVSITEEGITVETPLVEITGDVDVVGAVEIEGDVEITGAVEIEGDVAITGGLEVVGDVDMTGAAEIEGVLNVDGIAMIDGVLDIAGIVVLEGDITVLGAQQIVGNCAVGGIIEGVVVPPF
jgi:cytoskeletal protein CcmA (bactofilin family)